MLSCIGLSQLFQYMNHIYSNSFRYTFLWSSFQHSVTWACIFLYYLHIENKLNILDYFSHSASGMYDFWKTKGQLWFHTYWSEYNTLFYFLYTILSVLVKVKKKLREVSKEVLKHWNLTKSLSMGQTLMQFFHFHTFMRTYQISKYYTGSKAMPYYSVRDVNKRNMEKSIQWELLITLSQIQKTLVPLALSNSSVFSTTGDCSQNHHNS